MALRKSKRLNPQEEEEEIEEEVSQQVDVEPSATATTRSADSRQGSAEPESRPQESRPQEPRPQEPLPLPEQELVPALDPLHNIFDSPSQRLQRLFPTGGQLYNWLPSDVKTRVPPPTNDAVASTLRSKSRAGQYNAHSALYQNWAREWRFLQPSVAALIVAAEAAEQIAERADTSVLRGSVEDLASLLFDILDKALQQASVVIAATHDPALPARVASHFEAEVQGIHPSVQQLFKDHKPTPQARPSFWRGPDAESPKAQRRSRGRGSKPKGAPGGASSTSSTSAKQAD